MAVEEESVTKIEDIENKILADINNKKEIKENDAKLDNLLQKFSNKNESVNGNDFTEALKCIVISNP